MRAVGRPAVNDWDEDDQGIRIKDIRLRLHDFRQFGQDVLKEFKDICKDLFFGFDPPSIDLDKIEDSMVDDESFYSIVKSQE